MKIRFSRRAWRDWQSLPREVQERLSSKLKLFSTDPLRYAVKLTDAKVGQYRFRIGDYRVVFDLAGDEIQVLEVGHRKEIYR